MSTATRPRGLPADATRMQRAAWCRRMVDAGHSYREVGAMIGLSRSGVSALLNDPDGSKQKDRRERYRGACRVCGGKTDGSGGYGSAPSTCDSCARTERHENRYWTRERVLEAIRTWNDRRGRPPWSTDWLYTTKAKRTDPDGYAYPNTSTVLRECGSWLQAIRDAGLEPQDYARRRKPLAYFLEKLREASDNGVAPLSRTVPSVLNGIYSYGLSWAQACERVGVEPRTPGSLPTEVYLERLRELSSDGVAPRSTDPRAQPVRTALHRRGFRWHQACELAGLTVAPRRRRGYAVREKG